MSVPANPSKHQPHREVVISKSSYLRNIQCPKLLWHFVNTPDLFPEPEASQEAVFNQAAEVRLLARRLFASGIEPTRGSRDFDYLTQSTFSVLSLRKPVFAGAFAACGARCRVDVLTPSGRSGWDIVEIKSTTSTKDIHLHDLAFQAWVLAKAGLAINKIFLMHINPDYVLAGEVDPQCFFTKIDVTTQVSQLTSDVGANLSAMQKIIRRTEPPEIKIGSRCDDPYPCPLHESCWSFLPEENVLDLYRGREKGFKLLSRGIYRLAEIPYCYRLTGNQQIQRKVAVTNQPYLNKVRVKSFLQQLCYPIHFLDFETVWPAIPLFDGVRPYQQVPFQFSLHILDSEGAQPQHHMFLAKGRSDPRPLLMERLRGSIADNGSIVAFNASFEKARLKECCKSLPEFGPWVAGLENRFVDLLTPFRSFHYYHPKQWGSASMKAVLPVLTGKSYDDLAIHEGGMASSEFIRVTYNDVDEKERQHVRRQLEQYCGQDTEGMIWIVESLRNLLDATSPSDQPTEVLMQAR